MAHPTSGFYDSTWTRSIDELFIQILEGYSSYYEKELKVHNPWLLEQCRLDINRVYNTNFQMEDMVTKFFSLEDRYHAWRCIISREDVVYDDQSNTIAAKSQVWDNICHNYELGEAYRTGNEPNFSQLDAIFGNPQAMDGANETGGQPRIPSLQKAIKKYDDMKKEREVFRSFPHIIPRTIPSTDGLFPRGQYCPRPMFLLQQPRTSSRGEASSYREVDMDVRAKHIKKF